MSGRKRLSGGSYKRALDLGILILAHISLAPLWIILWTTIAVAIWLGDRGPVFYSQRRVGRDGRIFRLYKFRTMVPEADRIGPDWTAPADGRITRIGQVLRRTALDELPQLINIAIGDVSFVGPRALPIATHQEMCAALPEFTDRLKVRPGLTGLAQIYLPRTCPPRRRLAYDLLYIKRRSLRLDLYIIARSVVITLTGAWGVGEREAAQRTTRESR